MSAQWYKEQVNNNNYLSPIGFKFILEKAPKVAYLCQSVAIPEINLGSVEVPSPFLKYPIEGNINYGILNLTFLVDEDLTNYLQLHNWIRALGVPSTFTERAVFEDAVKYSRSPADRNIFSDGTISVLTNNLTTNFDVQFIDLIPTSLSTLEFDATVSEVEFFRSNVSFVYSYYEFRKRGTMKRLADSAWYN
jgi:hypothetical protein